MPWQSPLRRPMRPTPRLLVPIVLCAALLFAGALAGCTPLPPPATDGGLDAAATSKLGTMTPRTASDVPALNASTPAECVLVPITPPVMPTEIPGYAQVDPATGLHMTGTVQQIDLAGYRLKVTGKVDRPLSLTYDELRCMPKQQCTCTLVCPGFFIDRADWAGASLAHVLELAGIQAGAATVTLVSADGYSTPLTREEALFEENFLAYEQGGEPLPILHGFPVRAVLPSQMGGKWVKWLVEIKVE
jgi:DMSO/TMAO reductase YedYZ molybdopterin-dependent catalytic subunit